MAVLHQSHEALQALLGYGPDIYAATAEYSWYMPVAAGVGSTALHMAAYEGDMHSVVAILRCYVSATWNAVAVLRLGCIDAWHIDISLALWFLRCLAVSCPMHQ